MAGDFGNGTYSETQEMRTSGGSVTARAEEMREELHQMGDSFREAESVWSGNAFNSLKNNFNNFDTIFKSYSDMFNDLGGVIKQTASVFEDTEEDNVNIAARSNLG